MGNSNLCGKFKVFVFFGINPNTFLFKLKICARFYALLTIGTSKMSSIKTYSVETLMKLCKKTFIGKRTLFPSNFPLNITVILIIFYKRIWFLINKKVYKIIRIENFPIVICRTKILDKNLEYKKAKNS